MKNCKTSDLVIEQIYLLIPLIIYGIYKNGYLIYEKGLIKSFLILKPLYLVLIGVIIKIIIDLIRYKKIKVDCNLLYFILIGMIMPYNINIILYIICLTCLYIITNIIEKYIKFNKVCLIYLLIILINFIMNDFTFKSALELSYKFNYSFLDLLMGRSVGGISSTSIFFSLIAFVILIFNFYYKKDIPFFINLTYLLLGTIYFIIFEKSSILLNNDLIFASVFISALPEYSPYKKINQILYSILIGIFSFILSIYFNSIIAIYLSIFIVSLGMNIRIRQKKTKLPIPNS